MGGFNYYVTPAAQNFKITAAWERIVPNTAPPTTVTKNTNHFVVQLSSTTSDRTSRRRALWKKNRRGLTR
jgi:hypothetical protein